MAANASHCLDRNRKAGSCQHSNVRFRRKSPKTSPYNRILRRTVRAEQLKAVRAQRCGVLGGVIYCTFEAHLISH
jgi:hypothetical protein